MSPSGESSSRLGRYFAVALRHPVDAARFLFSDRGGRLRVASKFARSDDLDLLAGPCALLLRTDVESVRKSLREAALSRIAEHVRYCTQSNRGTSEVFEARALGQISDPELLYAVCRISKPQNIVETGVASGISSAFILEALRRNRNGRLFSIDLPNYENVLAEKYPTYYKPGSPGNLPPGSATGWVVPLGLRTRWTLRIGLSSDILPRLSKEVGEIDLFLHDSEHTYGNMMSEFTMAWSFLRTGGYLLSHDVAWNAAFGDFAKNVGREPMILGQIGAVRK